MMYNAARFFGLLVLLALVTAVQATPVGPLNYQGRLLNDQGVPVTGSYNFKVRIYDELNGGVLKYEEQHDNVQVNDGVYSFRVGSFAPNGTGNGDSQWDINLWQGNINDLYLEVEVNGETLSPRHELTSAPHAYTATLALSAGVLGNKTAAQYDNILEGICVASKGKWLDVIEECLGSGSVLTGTSVELVVSAGPSQLDFSNLDLSGADLSNTDFTNANFSNTDLTGATLTINNFDNANFSGAILDGTNFTDDMVAATNIDFTGATITQMDFHSWDMSGTILTGISSGPLLSVGGFGTGCPNLPVDWTCRFTQGGDAAVSIPVLLGPGVDVSAGSALAEASGEGVPVLPIEPNNPLGINPFNNVNLAGANFEGIIHQNKFGNGTNLTDTKMSYGVFRNIAFGNSTLNGTEFRHAFFEGTTFSPSATLTNVDFQSATLRNTQIEGLITNTDFNVRSFYRTVLKNVVLSQLGESGSAITFENSLVDNVKFGVVDGVVSLSSTTTDGSGGAQIVGNFEIGLQMPGASVSINRSSITGHLETIVLTGDFSGASIDSTRIKNAELAGDFSTAEFGTSFAGPALLTDVLLTGNFTNTDFAGALFTRGVLSGDFTNADFSGAYFSAPLSIPLPPTLSVTMSGNFTGANFSGATIDGGVIWDNAAICPNGFTHGSGSGDCPQPI